MDNNRLDEWRRAWLEDADESAITSLLSSVMSASYRLARLNHPRQDAEDVSVKVANYVWSVLEDVTDWSTVVERYTSRLTSAVSRARSKECSLKSEVKEIMMVNNKRATEEKRGSLRDFVVSALSSKEWNVIHSVYWCDQKPSLIAKRMGVSKRYVNMIRAGALEQLRMALGRIGVTKDTWKDWLYE